MDRAATGIDVSASYRRDDGPWFSHTKPVSAAAANATRGLRVNATGIGDRERYRTGFERVKEPVPVARLPRGWHFSTPWSRKGPA